MLRILFGLALIMCQSLIADETSIASIKDAREIPVLTINGAIGPAVADYLSRTISDAEEATNVPLILITLDTPGGLSSSLRGINQTILSSSVPIACLVYPQGARAASAGTYILYACHIAAMAPATTLGAATPVPLGAPATPASDAPKDNKKDAQPSVSAMEKKVLNDSIAYIRSLAQLRGRNVEWAELAVREAATLTADEALEKQVINEIAVSPQALIEQLDGQQIVLDGKVHTLRLSSASLSNRKPDWRTEFIATITDPNIAYILLLIGFYGLLLEFYSPGVGVSGVIGAISLVVALYALQLLPVNFAGMTLIFLGIGLLVAESMVPSFGIFGFGGLVSFVVGSIFLIDSDLKQFRIALPLIAAVTLVTGLFIIMILGFLWRNRKQKIVSGSEAIIGAEAIVMDDFQGQGSVWIEGESWMAQSEEDLKRGQKVRVQAVKGLVLEVASNQEEEKQDV